MAPPWYLFCLLDVSAVLGEYLQVIVGDPVTFSATGKCTKGKTAGLVYRVDHTTRRVADLQQGVWMPDDRYKDRVTSVNSCVVFNRTFYVDKGTYELTCDGSEDDIIDLDVIIAFDAFVTEGKTLTLRCHFKGEYVEWERNGTPVLGLNCSSGDIINGTGSKGKVSVSPDVCKQGDFSLTMKEAQLEDGGDYFCNVQSDGKKKRGTPAAVRLTINATESLTVLAVVIVVALVLGIGLGIGLGWLLKSKCSSVSP